MAQWLRLHALNVGGQVQSLAGELRFCSYTAGQKRKSNKKLEKSKNLYKRLKFKSHYFISETSLLSDLAQGTIFKIL